MKKIIAVVIGFTFLVLGGCDPTKVGGGGHQQPYNKNTGGYK